MEKTKKFYVTTPIYYVTAQPHLGSLYSTLLADTVARWNKLQGNSTFFLTGTDEHGQKIAQAAHKVGKEPKDFVDSFIPDYKKAWDLYDIQYDRFIRTTDDYHITGAQQLIQKLIDNGYVYTSEYTGMYCTPCETFVVDGGKSCPSCGRETALLSEETHFFKLSAFADKLLAFYKENPDFITPKERFNEVISFVQSELHDLSLSRTTVKWGVPFPKDPKHTVYVWVEALCNYITGVGYGQPHHEKEFKKWWPADVHVLGKDIVRFHAVYWPAMLMAAEMPLPKKLLVHGWIKVDKQKMSKSLGNVVDPLLLQEKYGAEPMRYYLLRQIPVNQDGDFSIADVEMRIESDLANDLGNLLNRMVALAHKYDVLTVEPLKVWSDASLELRDESFNALEDFERYMNDYTFHLALARLWKFINATNAYFHGQEPWKLAKSNPNMFLEIISATCHSLRTIALLLWPVMPKKMEELLASIGTPFVLENHTLENLELNIWNKSFLLHKIPTLFHKPVQEKAQENAMQQQEEQKKEELKKEDNYITIDDVIKVELLVGTIDACEEVEGSDKLVKMTVNLGDKGIRTILAGIKKSYAPGELVGKRGLYIANLKPRKMAGVESQGMMLVAEDVDGKVQLMQAPAGVPNGTRLK
jgi:methionyl-tRNA synthetase